MVPEDVPKPTKADAAHWTCYGANNAVIEVNLARRLFLIKNKDFKGSRTIGWSKYDSVNTAWVIAKKKAFF